MYRFLCEGKFSFLRDDCPGVKLLGHGVVLMYVLSARNFPHSFSCAQQILICRIFIFILFNVFLDFPGDFLSAPLFSCVLRSYVFGDFPVTFLYCFLVWSHCGCRTHFMISILFNMLRLVYGPVYVPWVLEENIYSAVIGWSILEILIRSCWPMVSGFFCVLAHFLSVVERGLLIQL